MEETGMKRIVPLTLVALAVVLVWGAPDCMG